MPTLILGGRRSNEVKFASAVVAALVVPLLAPRAVSAQSLLRELLTAGRSHALELQEQSLRVEQAAARQQGAIGSLLPSLDAEGRYTRNQVEETAFIPVSGQELEEVVFARKHALDAIVTVRVPLLALGSVWRLSAAVTAEDQARLTAEAIERQIMQDVARAYYALLGGSGLVEAAATSLETAEKNLEIAGALEREGLNSSLEVARASADVASARQSRAEAALAVQNARRELDVLTGIRVEGGRVPKLDEEVAPEEPLEHWLSAAGELPVVRAAIAAARAAEAEADAEWLDFAPELSATASERFTNTPAFGEDLEWSAGVELTWRPSYTLAAEARARNAEAEEARVAAARELRDARARIEGLYDQIESLRVRALAAREEARAAASALEVAIADFASGRISQLDLLQARRDAFTAEVGAVRAFADLAYAKAALRISVGRSEEIEG